MKYRPFNNHIIVTDDFSVDNRHRTPIPVSVPRRHFLFTSKSIPAPQSIPIITHHHAKRSNNPYHTSRCMAVVVHPPTTVEGVASCYQVTIENHNILPSSS